MQRKAKKVIILEASFAFEKARILKMFCHDNRTKNDMIWAISLCDADSILISTETASPFPIKLLELCSAELKIINIAENDSAK